MRRLTYVPQLLLAVVLGCALATTATAQLQTGNIYGTVKDDKANPLPGVTVTLSGGGAPQTQVSNAQGEFRFLSLAPGGYKLTAELEGFSKIDYPNVVVSVGHNTSIELTMNAAIEETITVTTESPLLDSRRISTGATLAKMELEKIPTSRDPWAILSSTPGVQTDRINVGGNESGQQAMYSGPGSMQAQSVWSVDGVVITDMAALGSSPSYYDFDAFEEMQVTTGGSDSTIATGGVVLNMVTKRGTNEWRGTGRYLKTSDSWQSSSGFSNSDLGHAFGTVTEAQPSFGGNTNRLVKVEDYGAELGGPIVKDRLWIWGSYGRQKPELLTLSNVSDKTDLKTWNGKLNAQVSQANSATVFYLDNDKVKIGRNAGPTRPQETTWDQSHFGSKPTAFKVEDTQIFSSNFYLTGLWSIVNGGFQLVPEGGLAPTSFLDSAGVWHNSYIAFYTTRPQKQYKADSSVFFSTGGLSHELKFGAGYRIADVTSLSGWPGSGFVLDSANCFGSPYPNCAAITRFKQPATKLEYKSAYAQDTLTAGNLTANIGLRYDVQGGENLARTVAANPILPNILPAVSYGGGDVGFEWKRLTPRLGLTYALGAERKTLLRFSYSRFADQLGSATASQLNPLNGYSYAYMFTTNTGQPTLTPGQIVDLNGDGTIGPDDVLFYTSSINPYTGGLLQSNGVSKNLNAPLTNEFLLSAEHALMPEFVVGFNLTYRKLTDLIQADPLVFDGSSSYSAANIDSIGRRATRSDYALCGTPGGVASCPTGVLPDGQTYTIPYYTLKTGIFTRGGTYLYNSGSEQTYKGASLTFNKRLANRWMLRGNFSYSDWYWSALQIVDPNEPRGGGGRVDDQVIVRSTGSGSKGDVFVGAKWSYSLNGMYQVAPDRGWGFNLAANLTGRQGYSLPYWRRIVAPSNYENGPAFTLAATDRPDDFRNPNLHVLDLRAEKELHFGDFGVTLGVDCFNVTNEGTVLQRNTRLNQSSSDWVRETISPRVFRLGARISWK